MTLSVTRRGKNAGYNVRTALTLVEVVTVIAALVVLIAALAPAVATVPRNGKDARCLSNLMRIGYANSVYAAQDATNMAIPVHPMQFQQCGPDYPAGEVCYDPIFVGAYEWGGKSGVGRPGFVDGPSEGPDAWMTSRYGTKAGFGPATRPLNGMLFKQAFGDHLNPGFDQAGALEDTQLDLDVLRCPSDTGATGIHCPQFTLSRNTSCDHFGTSYNANIFMTATIPGRMQSNSPYLHGISEVRNPARTLAYEENNGRFAWTAAPEPCDFLCGVPGYVRGWHGKDWTFNASFVDGHADTIYKRGYRSELVYPDNKELQAYYHCIIVRGEGWQIDTLPSPTVATRLWFSGQGGRPSYEGCLDQDCGQADGNAAGG